MKHPKLQKGFTLVEILLVMVVIAMILFGATNMLTQRAEQARIDRTSMQMQQILNAAMTYYVMNGSWPIDLNCLMGTGSTACPVNYLGVIYMQSPWAASSYTAGPCTDNQTMFCVSVTTSGALKGSASAKVLAGTLPLARIIGTYTVEARVTIPGQNLNNARSVNFAGLFHQGGCVPVPVCPTDPATGVQMTAQVMVVPVQVSGVNDVSAPNNSPNSVYPISSFTAYATDIAASPAACTNSTYAPSCNATDSPTGTFWRACMQIVTEKGDVQSTNTGTPYWGQYISMMAMTRCTVNNEKSGSDYTTIYGN